MAPAAGLVAVTAVHMPAAGFGRPVVVGALPLGAPPITRGALPGDGNGHTHAHTLPVPPPAPASASATALQLYATDPTAKRGTGSGRIGARVPHAISNALSRNSCRHMFSSAGANRHLQAPWASQLWACACSHHYSEAPLRALHNLVHADPTQGTRPTQESTPALQLYPVTFIVPKCTSQPQIP